MKLFNHILYSTAALGLSLLVMTSCDDKVEYTPAGGVSGAQVYFSPNPKTQYQLSEDNNSFTIDIYRANANEAITVPVTVTSDEENTNPGAFSFPDYVSFAAGEKQASYVVTYDLTDMEYDDNQYFTLKIDDAAATPYGVQTLDITCVYPAPWTLLGKGQYYDYYWGVQDTEDDWFGPVTVNVYQNDIDPAIYRISNPYIEWNGEEDNYFQFRLLQEGEEFLKVTIEGEDLVGYADYYIDYNPNYNDDVYIVWPGRFVSNDTGEPLDYSYNKVVDWQDDDKTMPGLIEIAPYYYMFNNGGWNYTTDPPIQIIFPGYTMLDTEISVTYEGMQISGTSTEANIMANVNLGADVTSAKVGVYFSDFTAQEIAQAIDNGDINSVEISESGLALVPFDLSHPPDRYSIVADSYVDGEMRGVGSVNFSHIQKNNADDNEGWTSLGYVDYTDGYVCSRYIIDAETYSVELQELDSDPGYYRLVNPYGEPFPYNEAGDYQTDINSYLYIDATNPDQVVIDFSKQTLDWGAGELTCYSLAAYYLDNNMSAADVEDEGLFGTLANGVISFPARTLIDLWGGEGFYYANYAYDAELFMESGTQDYLYNADGSLYAPFSVDMSAPSAQPKSVAGTRAFMVQRNLASQKLGAKYMVPQIKKVSHRGKMDAQPAKSSIEPLRRHHK